MHIHRYALDLERANQMKVARGRAGGQDSHIGRQKANRQGRSARGNVGVHDRDKSCKAVASEPRTPRSAMVVSSSTVSGLSR